MTNTVLGLAALGIGGYVLVKYVLPKLDLDLDLAPSRRERDEDDDEPERVPVFIPSPPQTIVEERLVPVSPPPVYVYPPPVVYPNTNCGRGRYWDGNSCEKIECPPNYRWDDGVCKPREIDCDRGEYWDGSRCRDLPHYPHNCDRGEYWDSSSNRCRRIDCDRDQYFDGTRCRDLPDRNRPRFPPRDYNPPTPRPDRDWDEEGRDRDDDDDRNSRKWKLGDIFGRRDKTPTPTTPRPRTNITTLLTPSPKVEEEETDRDEEDDDENGRQRPRTSPVAALAGFTGRRYEYI